MRSLLLIAVTAVALIASASSAGAATISGQVRGGGDGTDFGTMEFRAGSGVANRVTIRRVGGPLGSFVITERAERLRASGDCEQVNRHTARCPVTESDAAVEIVTRDRADRVEVELPRVAVRARGGEGGDLLLGGGEFYGDSGDDTLRAASGVKSWDRFHGGPGRDLMVGRGQSSKGATDIFYDDETDTQAARDVIRGGADARATLDYSMRDDDLSIDLRDARLGPDGDRVSGVRNLVTGAGDDELIGTGGTNMLGGGPGDDLLVGRGGGDVLGGGGDDDELLGGNGRDRLEEISFFDVRSGDRPRGSDRFVGGPGRDQVRSADTDDPDGEIFADDVQCDVDDEAVTSDPADLLRDCRWILGWGPAIPGFQMQVVPQLTDEGAVFTLRCAPTEFDDSGTARCRGEIVLTGASGTEFGRRGFDFTSEDPIFWPEVTVTVPLSDAGRAAIEANEVIGVRVNPFSSNGFRFPPVGYRAELGED